MPDLSLDFSWWKMAKKGLKGAAIAGSAAAAATYKAKAGDVSANDLWASFIAGATGFAVLAVRNWMKNR